MKKNLFILAALAGVALVGCNKNVNLPEIETGRRLNSTVTIQIGTKGTKAEDANATANEDMVNTLDVFIFNDDPDRTLDAYAHAVAESSVGAGDGFVVNGEDRSTLTYSVESTSGPKTIVAVLNMPARMSPATIATVDDLEAKIFNLLDNVKMVGDPGEETGQLSNFQMIGATHQSLNPGANDVAISVDRIAARIRIKKITRNFESAALQGKTMSIDRIYISNAVGSHGFTYDEHTGAITHVNKVGNNDDNPWFYKYMNQDNWDIDDQDYTSADPADYYAGYVAMYADPTSAPAAWDPSVPSANINGQALWLRKSAADFVSPYTGGAIANNSSIIFATIPEQSFYVMPNSLTPNHNVDDPDSDDPADVLNVANDDRGRTEDAGVYAWTPRLSKMVIEATLDGKKVYYAIPLAVMAAPKAGMPAYPSGTITAGLQSNYSYDLEEVVLTRPGSTDPDTPVELSELNLTITINPWNIQAIQTEEGKYVI